MEGPAPSPSWRPQPPHFATGGGGGADKPATPAFRDGPPQAGSYQVVTRPNFRWAC